ncbi:hypothetical protein GCM10022261_07220 [Brevibacterium daeguense]|uniref:Uncharacterized protein n=1 Tax=Brevibacterium daeguense TaxID=909936 RepID=A0ABP8EGV8_9MICO
MPGPGEQIAIVKPALWNRFRDLRLAALAGSPEMLGSAPSRERDVDESEWRCEPWMTTPLSSRRPPAGGTSS